MYCWNYKVHTHSHAADELQVGATIWVTTKAEKKDKDSSGTTERVRRDISNPRLGGSGVKYYSWPRCGGVQACTK
jgi:hypothetical protein